MEARNRLFQQLKPPCVKLNQAALKLTSAGGSDVDVIDALEQLLQVLRAVPLRPAVLDDKLAEYVVFPLVHVFRGSRKLPFRGLELALQCLLVLLKTGYRSRIAPDLGGQLLIFLTLMAGDSPRGRETPGTSEELQRVAFQCLGELLFCLTRTDHGRSSLTSTASIPALDSAVTLMLGGIQDGTSNEVQLAALAALQSFTAGIADRDILSSFLPGVISALTKVLTPSTRSRRNYRVLEGSLNVYSEFLKFVVSDEQTKGLPKGPSPGEGVERTLRKQLDGSWLKASASQIKMALANVIKLQQHDRAEVRRALFRLCLSVLEECQTSLSESASMMVETMVNLARGNNDEIRGTLKHIVASERRIAELLRSSLHTWVISLPRLMQSPNESAKERLIHQISMAYRTLSDRGIDLAIVDRVMATSLRDSVADAVKDRKTGKAVVETAAESASWDVAPPSQISRSTSFEPIIMGARSQEATVKELQHLCQQISQAGSYIAIARELVDSVRTSRAETQLSSFWLSLNLLEASKHQSLDISDFLDLGGPATGSRRELLEDLYSFSLSTLTDSTSETETEIDWRLQALSLRALALQAQELKHDFRVELIDALYPVVRLVGSPLPPVRSHAITCLNILAEECGHSSASDLILSNVDYLVNAVALKLNTFDISPQAPQVLLMMIRLSGPALLPYLDDLVGSMFAALECFHGYPKLVELLFSVLRGIAEEGIKTPQLAIMMERESRHLKQPFAPTTIGDIAASLKEHQKRTARPDDMDTAADAETAPQRPWKETATSLLDAVEAHGTTADLPGAASQDVTQASDTNAEPAENPPPPAPKTYTTLLHITQLTQHYLTSSSASLRSSLLGLLSTTFPTLATHEDSFLPLIHTLWPVLLPRLDDPEAYVVANAAEVVGKMCEFGGDFMTGRIEDAWPALRRVWTTRAGGALAAGQKVKSRAAPGGGRRTGSGLGSRLLVGGETAAPTLAMATLSLSPAARAVVTPYTPAPTRLLHGAMVSLFTTVVRFVGISDETFDEIVDLLAPVLASRPEVREVLERRNPDAVWLALVKLQRREGAAGQVRDPPVARRGGWGFARVGVVG